MCVQEKERENRRGREREGERERGSENRRGRERGREKGREGEREREREIERRRERAGGNGEPGLLPNKSSQKWLTRGSDPALGEGLRGNIDFQRMLVY